MISKPTSKLLKDKILTACSRLTPNPTLPHVSVVNPCIEKKVAEMND